MVHAIKMYIILFIASMHLNFRSFSVFTIFITIAVADVTQETQIVAKNIASFFRMHVDCVLCRVFEIHLSQSSLKCHSWDEPMILFVSISKLLLKYQTLFFVISFISETIVFAYVDLFFFSFGGILFLKLVKPTLAIANKWKAILMINRMDNSMRLEIDRPINTNSKPSKQQRRIGIRPLDVMWSGLRFIFLA